MKYIDLTPTWAEIMPALVAVIENGTAEGVAMARKELARLAQATDEANALAKSGLGEGGIAYAKECLAAGATIEGAIEAARQAERRLAEAENEEPDGHTTEAVLVTTPNRAATTYALFMDYTGKAAAYWLPGKHAAAHVLRHGQKMTEGEARARFDFPMEYRK